MTLKEVLEQTTARHGDRSVLRFKQNGIWRTRSFNELRARTRTVSEICAKHGVRHGDRVALYRENSPEWFELYLGITALGAVAVPVDARLREQEVLHILHDSGAVLLFASARFYPLLEPLADRLPALENAVLLEGETVLPTPPGPLRFTSYHTECEAVRTAAQQPGAAYDQTEPDAEDTASIIYTSGTTGRPKGAMLTHRNFISNVESSIRVLQPRPDDRFLLLLPLHHSFAFTAVFLIPLYAGCEICLVENLRTLAQNMAETGPSVVMAVPLLLEKMVNRVMEGINRRFMGRLLMRIGLGRLIGRGVIRKMGGHLRLMVTGAAPCPPGILKAWKRLGIPVLEGYGITETAPVLTINPPGKTRPGTVGPAIPGVEIRIDRPDANGVGEVAVRGPNVMKGYWNTQTATDEVLRGGWYFTGDLGFLDPDGYLTICGRKKSLIVNREGKNIYPEEVELELLKSPYLLECLVTGCRVPGDPGERVGVIAVPDMEALGEKGTLADEEIETLLRQEIRRHAAALAPYKRPRHIQVRYEEFEKTSTAKIKRHLYAMDLVTGEYP
jgi:long-chain acyl-CoA synthetase